LKGKTGLPLLEVPDQLVNGGRHAPLGVHGDSALADLGVRVQRAVRSGGRESEVSLLLWTPTGLPQAKSLSASATTSRSMSLSDTFFFGLLLVLILRIFAERAPLAFRSTVCRLCGYAIRDLTMYDKSPIRPRRR